MADLVKPMTHTRRRGRAEIPESADVVIVGAGTAGLTAGAYLAKHGMSVVVFDPHYVAGGCGTMFTRTSEVGDFHFDVGLHYIGDCAPGGQIPSLMEPLGVDVTYRPMDQDGFDTLVFSDYRFRIPASVDAYRDRLVADFPSEAKGIDRYVRLLREVMHLGKVTNSTRGRSVSSRVGGPSDAQANSVVRFADGHVCVSGRSYSRQCTCCSLGPRLWHFPLSISPTPHQTTSSTESCLFLTQPS